MSHDSAVVLLAVLATMTAVQYASLLYVVIRYWPVAAAREVRMALMGAGLALGGASATNALIAVHSYTLFDQSTAPGWFQIACRVPQIIGGLLAFQILRERLDVRVVSKHMAEEARERRAHEAALEEVRRMESLGRMARGIVHDISHVITVIKGFGAFIGNDAALMNDGKDPGAYARVKESLKFVDDAVTQTEKLRDDLIDFSRGEGAGTAKVTRPNEVVREVARLLRFPLVEVHVDLRAPEEFTVPLSPANVRQVLLNLAMNGRDAMPTGGKLRIQTLALDGHLGLRVTDTGCGMAADVALKVFEPFYTTKAKTEGTGLGLSTVYGIVMAAGGRVRISTDPGEGTDVLVILPLAVGASS